MRLDCLSQVARVAIVIPPSARMGSLGVLVDCLEMTRAHVWRQYGAVDVLPAADRFGVVDMSLLAIGGISARTEGGTVIPAAAGLGEERYDVVAICDHAVGGGGEVPAYVPSFTAWLLRRWGEGSAIAACGASVAFVADAGLLDGRDAAAPRWLEERFRRRWPRVCFVSDTGVVDHEAMLTSAGGAADIHLAVRLVEAITSTNTARWLAEHMGLTGALGDKAGTDTLLARAQDWIADRYSQKISIGELAREMGVNRRTLHRHFRIATGAGPAEYLQSVRIEASKRMLERTPFPVERIAALVGYGDGSAYRLVFRNNTGMSPRAWRTRSRTPAGN